MLLTQVIVTDKMGNDIIQNKKHDGRDSGKEYRR
jgi:hypothetical protein